MPRTVFISHRQADKGIAEVIRYHLKLWGVPDGDIASSFHTAGLPKLNAELRQTLWETRLLILVYAEDSQDWAYCMWEAGVASHPSKADTNLVVFLCGNEKPSVFSGDVNVPMTGQSIASFVSAFFRKPGFFPGQPPHRPDVADEDVEYFSRRLYQDLKRCGCQPQEGDATAGREFDSREYLREMSRAHSIFGSPAPGNVPCDLFMVMPFTEELKPVFEDHVKMVGEEFGLRVARGDDFTSAGPITNQVWAGIHNAKVVVADCTGNNANVFYEVGLAHALDKTTLLITQSLNDVPFDLRNLRIIEYKYTPRGMKKFEQDLRDTLRNILGQGQE